MRKRDKEKQRVRELKSAVAGILIHLPPDVQRRRTERRLADEREGDQCTDITPPPEPPDWFNVVAKMAARDGTLIKLWLRDQTRRYKDLPALPKIRTLVGDVSEGLTTLLWGTLFPEGTVDVEFDENQAMFRQGFDEPMRLKKETVTQWVKRKLHSSREHLRRDTPGAWSKGLAEAAHRAS